jgi:hypothetical protein
MTLFANSGPAWALCAETDPGATAVHEDALPPAGSYHIVGSSLFDLSGVPTMQYNFISWSLSEGQALKLAEAEEAYDDHRQRPFQWNFGTIAALDDNGASLGATGVQHLQMRDDGRSDDIKNWLAAQVGALTALLGGQGAHVLPLKTSGNIWVQTTCADVAKALAGGDGVQIPMLARQQAMLSKIGSLKKAIAAAQTYDDLAAIDVTTGWLA